MGEPNEDFSPDFTLKPTVDFAMNIPARYTGFVPRFQPMLLGRLQEAFSHPDWLFEVKWDGFRALLYSDKDGVREFSAERHHANWRFPVVGGFAGQLRVRRLHAPYPWRSLHGTSTHRRQCGYRVANDKTFILSPISLDIAAIPASEDTTQLREADTGASKFVSSGEYAGRCTFSQPTMQPQPK